jgi:tRNA A37 methylthiotransferase MiaB
MNVECRYFRKEKNIETFGCNKERGDYMKMEKKLHLNEKFYGLFSSNMKVIKARWMSCLYCRIQYIRGRSQLYKIFQKTGRKEGN